MQLVTVRSGYCPVEARLMLLHCSAVLGHHVNRSYFANWASVVSHLLLLLNCASTPSTALDASVISDKVRMRSLVQAYIHVHCRHSAGLLQRYTSRNSWHCDKRAVQLVQKTAARLVSGTIFRDLYHYFTQPHWLLVWRRIVSKSTILSLSIYTLHMTG